MVGFSHLKKAVLFAFLFSLCAASVFSQASNVTYNSSLIDAVLINPKFGMSQVDKFDLWINVSNTSTCRYSYNPDLNYSEIISPVNQFTTDDGKAQKIVDFSLLIPEGETKAIYVLCKTPSGYVNDGFPMRFNLGIDRTEPQILTADANPSLVIEIPKTVLSVTTDDESVCRFDKYAPTQEEFNSYYENANISKFNKTNKVNLIPPNIVDNKDYTYSVTCMNRAKLFATEIRTISFTVNLSAENKITKTLPTGYITNSSQVNIWVETNRDSTCRYGLDTTGYASIFPQEHAKSHLIQKTNLQDNTVYTYNLRCEFDQGSPSTIDTSFSFAVDMTKPKQVAISATSETCRTDSLSAAFNSNDTDSIGIYYRLLDQANNQIAKYALATAANVTLDSLSLTPGQKYYWEAFSIDKAGNNGTSSKSLGTSILAADSDQCIPNKPPFVNKTIKITEAGVTVILECKDEDGCREGETTFLLINSKTPLCECGTNACNYTRYDLPLFGIKENTTICYKATDNKNLSVSGSFSLSYVSCNDNETACCAGKKALVCDGNCTVVSQKECDTTKIDSDSDGISDIIELSCGLDPKNATDALADTDGDGLINKDECINYKTNITLKDTDGDGFSDKAEIEKGTSPLDKNSFPKDITTDTDKDGIKDYQEKDCGLDPNKNDASLDNDDDGLTNKEECLGQNDYNFKSDPNKADTDGDGYNDKAEIAAGTDPNDSSDFPKSHVLSIVLISLGVCALGAGAFFIIKNKNSLKMPGMPGNAPAGPMFSQPQEYKANLQKNREQQPFKINVDFRQAKKELHTESKQVHPMEAASETDLDYQIKKKKEWLRVRQMSSVFEEFGKESQEKNNYPKSEDLITKLNRERAKERVGIFERLDDISKNNAFEQIEGIKKKAKLTDEEEDKLDRLGKFKK